MGVRIEDRLVSLDAFRGLTIVAMILVNNPGDWNHLYPPLAHARWHGWTPTDLIFPFFLFIVGVSMVASLAHRREPAGAAALFALWRRAAVIVLLGLGLNLVPAFDLNTLRWPGVLQRIGLCVALAAPVVLWGGARGTLLAIAALVALYLGVMFGWPVIGADGVRAAGRLEPGQDAGAALDRWLMAGHLWSASKTWDPEGLFGTTTATATLLIGSLAGRALWPAERGLDPERQARRASIDLGMAGVVCLIAGLVLDRVLMPINKPLWTVSYVVFTAGAALLAFALCHAALDSFGSEASRARWRALMLPFTIHGMNALFLFVVSGLIARGLGVWRVADGQGGTVSAKTWLAAWPKAWIAVPELASLVYALGFCAAMAVLAVVLWRNRVFVKV